ncbi:cytochrome P450 [Aspergillus floccosus]
MIALRLQRLINRSTPGWPIVGNLFDIDPKDSIMSLVRLGKQYYPLYKLNMGGAELIMIVSASATQEVCDERRFHKNVTAGLERLRPGIHDGLFSAHDHERNWELAHRLLIPVFGPIKIREMFPQMVDIAEQLRLKWLRYGLTAALNVTEDFTRLTLDTIALCGMSYRFNSFYSAGDFHPFVTSMIGFMQEADIQGKYPAFVNNLRFSAKKKFEWDIETMRQTCADIIAKRRNTAEAASNDLLSAMLNNRDHLSGEGLSDESTIDNMVTFLIAGHETTSGLLSFTMYYLLKTPRVMEEATKEVDEVIGDEEVTVDHLSRLKFITAILRESLRMMPTAPAFGVTPYKDEMIVGKYPVKPGDSILVFLPSVHRDPAVFGPDPDAFRPERMMDEEFEKLPFGAWKPFGNGKRGCIGRAFAWQEALLVMALILRDFSFSLADPHYELKIQKNLTIKPTGLYVHATPRPGKRDLPPDSPTVQCLSTPKTEHATESGIQRSVTVLYGSNSGTCELMARRMTAVLAKHGLFPRHTKELDSSVDRLPKNEPVIIITGSYDGKPPGNAVRFTQWLTPGKPDQLNGVRYAVFGCGHRDWASTLYEIPVLLDEKLEKCGAKRFAPRGLVDVADEDPLAKFECWQEQVLWPCLHSEFGLSRNHSSKSEETSVKIVTRPPHLYRGRHETGTIGEVKIISAAGTPSIKAHIELFLSGTIHYEAGDNLSILPVNPRCVVERVLCRFKLGWDTILEVSSGRAVDMPTGRSVSAVDLLSNYVELGQVATTDNLKLLSDKTECSDTRERLSQLSSCLYASLVLPNRLSVLDVLERYPSISFSFEQYLNLLPPLRPRLYTISSAPGMLQRRASLTISVKDVQAPGGCRNRGVASAYLLESMTGTLVRLSLRHPNPLFHPPTDPSAHPIIMIAAGSGIAPFRAFTQQRLLQKQGGMQLAPALLFFGCRGAHLDDIYRDELDKFEADGLVTVYRAFSRDWSHLDANGCRYVQDRIWAEKEQITKLWEQGAVVFVCGGRNMSEAVKGNFMRIISSNPEEHPSRYIVEVFA